MPNLKIRALKVLNSRNYVGAGRSLNLFFFIQIVIILNLSVGTQQIDDNKVALYFKRFSTKTETSKKLLL